MAFEDDFLDCMPHEIKVKTASTASDRYNRAGAVTAASTYACLIQYESKMVRGFDGTDKLSTHNALVNCTGSIQPYDTVTLPDGTAPVMISIATKSDNDGQHHVQIFFGSNVASRGR